MTIEFLGVVPDVEMFASPVSVSQATRHYFAAWPAMSRAFGALGSVDDNRISLELREKIRGLVVTANPPCCLAAFSTLARCMSAFWAIDCSLYAAIPTSHTRAFDGKALLLLLLA